MTNRTTSYVMTVQMKDGKPFGEGVETLEKLRAAISATNKIVGSTQFYVKLQGRLGKNNPAAVKYRSRANGGTGPYYKCQAVRLADAQFADVYIYTR